MSNEIAIVTGSGGLVGSETVRYFAKAGFDVVGIDNNLRAHFFGPSASTASITERLQRELDGAFTSVDLDIRDTAIERVFLQHRHEIGLVVHAAAQPAHDWAAKDPRTDFGVNAVGTLNLLEMARRYCPDVPFIYCSTSKVYGDHPNFLPLEEHPERLELPLDHQYYTGIDTTMSIDGCTHSLFGVSKASADLLVQEYGRYFNMPTVCFRPGCISGPAHQGAQLHGFLAYLMRCTVTGDPYTVFGYNGKQVRCNIHAYDLVTAFDEFRKAPRSAVVYNIGSGRRGACSMREAIDGCEQISGHRLRWELSDAARIGDHRWWISDIGSFIADYPNWEPLYDFTRTLTEIYEANSERWLAVAA